MLLLVILTIVGITLLLVFGAIWLTNVLDKNKQQNVNTDEKPKENHVSYFSSWWKFAIVGLIGLFIFNAWINSIDTEAPIKDDWNNDGKVDEKDLDTYMKWKDKQGE